MGYLGEKIKEARQEKGVTIAQAAETTKIKSGYLQALENEDFEELPPRAYVKGFLKIYARYLGLDYELLLSFLEESYADSQPEVVFAQPKKIRSIPFLPGLKISTALGVVGAAVCIGLLIWGAVQLIGGLGHKPPTDGFNIADPPYARETIERITLPADPGSDTGEPAELALTARSDRKVWLEVRADGTLVFFGNLSPGVPVSWKAEKEFRIRTVPEPEGLTFILDGSPVSLPDKLPSDGVFTITGGGLTADD